MRANTMDIPCLVWDYDRQQWIPYDSFWPFEEVDLPIGIDLSRVRTPKYNVAPGTFISAKTDGKVVPQELVVVALGGYRKNPYGGIRCWEEHYKEATLAYNTTYQAHIRWHPEETLV